MSDHSLTFDAIAEVKPGPKWQARWQRSWPAYQAWFTARRGDEGPSRSACEAALRQHMPELVPVHRRLSALAGGGDRAACFLSTWCPPAFLSGCSIAARSDKRSVRLVRNYDLSPDLNEGLLLRSAWTGMPVMGMVEFLWGLSDGINGAGLTVALAFGGRSEVREGFGITTILRYVLETCSSVAEALAVLRRVPSHMAYNVTLADRLGRTATAELSPGGGARILRPAIATNHQHGLEPMGDLDHTSTLIRHAALKGLVTTDIETAALSDAFLKPPLFQTGYAEGFGTLFTADYNPLSQTLWLRWPEEDWTQSLDRFQEGQRRIVYNGIAAIAADLPGDASFDLVGALAGIRPFLIGANNAARFDHWAAEARHSGPDWAHFGRLFA